jgi:hypothetical protein
MPEVAATRRAMLNAYREGLEALLGDATRTIGYLEEAQDVPPELLDDAAADDGDPAVEQAAAAMDEAFRAVPVITRRDVDEALAAIFGQAMPMPDDTAAEVRTPASVIVFAICPRCGLAQPIAMTIHPELLVSEDGSELRIKAKAKARTHICGQLPLPVGPESEVQTELNLEAEVTASEDDCPFPGCSQPAEHEGDHDEAGVVELEPGEDDAA